MKVQMFSAWAPPASLEHRAGEHFERALKASGQAVDIVVTVFGAVLRLREDRGGGPAGSGAGFMPPGQCGVMGMGVQMIVVGVAAVAAVACMRVPVVTPRMSMARMGMARMIKNREVCRIVNQGVDMNARKEQHH